MKAESGEDRFFPVGTRGLSIFTTTYNVGDCKNIRTVATGFNEWIPLNRDLYCIAFQVGLGGQGNGGRRRGCE